MLSLIVAAVTLVAVGQPEAPPLEATTLSTRGSTRGTAYAAANKIVTVGQKTHAAWLDSGSVTMIQTYDAATGAWGDPVEVGRGRDNHGGPALCADGDGHLHIVFGPHHGPFQYRRSLRPNDASEWTPVEETGDRATYPSLVCDADGTLHLAYRGGAQPWKLMYQKKPRAGAWTAPVALVRSPAPSGYTQWGNPIQVDRNGRLHLAFHFYDVAIHKAGFAAGYLYSDDHGDTWRATSGKAVALPATIDTCEPFLNSDAINIRIGTIDVGPEGAVYVTVPHLEKGGVTQLWRLRDGAWKALPLDPHLESLYGCGPLGQSVVSVAADGAVYLLCSVCVGGWSDPVQEVALLASRDQGDTFAARRISPVDPATPNWLPSIERNTGHGPVARPHMMYTHGHAGEGCTPDLTTEIRFVRLR